MSWNATHMCDSGIDGTIGNLKDAISELAKDAVKDIDTLPDFEIVDGSVKITDWNGIDDEIAEEIVNSLDRALEDVVSDIDEHMGYIKENAHESLCETGDYAYIGDGDYVYHTDIDETETYKELEKEKEELEEQLEEMKSGIKPHGHIEPLSWNEGRQRFVCPITGRVYKLVEEMDNPVPMA